MPPKSSATFSINQILPAIIVAIALISSLQAHDYSYNIRWFLLAWFMLLCLILGKLFVSYDKQIPLPTNKPFYFFSAFLTWAALSTIWSAVPGDTLLVAMTFTICLLGMLLSFWANEKQWHYFRHMLTAISIITIAYTAWQRFALDIQRPAGFLLNWNTNSTFIAVILLPHCASFLNQTKQQGKPYLAALFIILSAFGMSLGESRGALTGFLFGLGVIIFSAWRMQYGIKPIALLLTLILAGYLSGDLLNDSAVIERLSKTTTQLNQQNQTEMLESIGSGRHALWDAGWRMFLDKPYLGWGLGIYHRIYPQYRPPLLQELGMYAHNDYLQFLLELGPVGLLLSLAFVVSVLLSGLKLYRIDRENPEKLLHLGLFASCLTLLSHSLVSFNFYQVSTLLLLGLFIGRIGNFYNPKQLNFKPASAMTKSGYFSILGSSSALLSLWALSIFIGFLSVQKALATSNPQQQFQHFRKASELLPFLDEFQTRQIMLILSVLNRPSASEKLNQQETERFLDYALEQAEEAIKNNPLRYRNFNNKAKVLYAISTHTNRHIDPGEIIDNLKRSVATNPYKLDSRLLLAESYAQNGDQQHQREVLLDGLNRMYTEEYKIGLAYLLTLKQILQSPSDDALLNGLQHLIEKQQKLINGPNYFGPFKFKIS